LIPRGEGPRIPATARPAWLECRPRGHERRSLASTDSSLSRFHDWSRSKCPARQSGDS
jgi:hypothetical protein